jgi:mevalonate pyrophosphate decarboxylase
METQTSLLREIEEIKARLIGIETTLIKNEKPSKSDTKAVKEALDEYRKGKTIKHKF